MLKSSKSSDYISVKMNIIKDFNNLFYKTERINKNAYKSNYHNIELLKISVNYRVYVKSLVLEFTPKLNFFQSIIKRFYYVIYFSIFITSFFTIIILLVFLLFKDRIMNRQTFIM